MQENIPELQAYDCGDTLVVWCKYCVTHHTHSPGEGHRWAHCWKDDSPYKKGGYILKRNGIPMTRGIMERHRIHSMTQ
jgi:hypothetical protein